MNAPSRYWRVSVTPEQRLALKEAYPKRAKGNAYAWPAAFKQCEKRMSEGYSFDELLEGTKNYCAGTKADGSYGTCYVKQASTFYGPDLHFLDEFETEDATATAEPVYRRPEQISPEQLAEDRRKGEEQLKRLQNVQQIRR